MSTSGPLEDFFAQWADQGFTYRGNSTAHSNFKRLCKVFQWNKGLLTEEFITARMEFNNALVLQFNSIYGKDNDLPAWQKFCSVIDITPIPNDINECQRLVREVHVNIVDVLETARTGKQARKFASLKELKAYTLNTGKIFPKGNAYAGGLLKELLREIGKRRNGGKKRRRRKGRKQAGATQSS